MLKSRRVFTRAQAIKLVNGGVFIDATGAEELARFSREYATYLGCDWDPYFRADVYPNDGKLAVIEVNTAFVDGWGTALNLSRAVGRTFNTKGLFPDKFVTTEREYKPELQLLIGELGTRAVEIENVADTDELVYVYGRSDVLPPNAVPRQGKELDNKLRLAEFSEIWDGDCVVIPKSYSALQGNSWEDIPDDVYVKFVDKSSKESEKARFSVKRDKPTGKAPFIKRAFREGKLIAQDTVPEYWEDINGVPKATQLVVLNVGVLFTGYVQYGNGYIINDNSVHAPLLIGDDEVVA